MAWLTAEMHFLRTRTQGERERALLPAQTRRDPQGNLQRGASASIIHFRSIADTRLTWSWSPRRRGRGQAGTLWNRDKGSKQAKLTHSHIQAARLPTAATIIHHPPSAIQFGSVLVTSSRPRAQSPEPGVTHLVFFVLLGVLSCGKSPGPPTDTRPWDPNRQLLPKHTRFLPMSSKG